MFASTSLVAAPQFAWVGTYSPNGEGIYRFDIDNQTGQLSRKVLAAPLTNAAQLVLSKNGKVLYAGSETEKGTVHAWQVKDNGELQAINNVSSGGDGPVYLSITPDGRYLLVANYHSGAVSVLPIRDDGGLLPASEVIQHDGPAGAAYPEAAVEGSFAISDHNGPHAHMIATDPSGEYVFTTDLGLDRIYQYRFDGKNGKLIANDPPYIMASSKGAGPRHFVFSKLGDRVWLVNEEASTLTEYQFDKQKGTLKEKATVSTLPESYKGTNFISGIVESQDGKHLYVGNRLHNSVAHFSINEEGSLSKVSQTWTRGDYPRTLTLSPDGQYLYVMNQRSDNITRFKVEPNTGELVFVDDYVPIGAPSQMVVSETK
ncbi:lactonase family protein [Providencia stuartii]|nr:MULTISPECIES: lactonase family protein [Providencia]MDN0020648.1 lactonase family protein [Providencia stuartii]